MFVDVCFSENNERDYVKLASKLKTKAIIFLDKKTLKLKKSPGLDKIKRIKFSNNFKASKNTVYYLKQEQRNFLGVCTFFDIKQKPLDGMEQFRQCICKRPPVNPG